MASPKRAATWVLHVDMDQFIAAVEILRRPELAGLPVIVGGRGDATERAVVSTASYDAVSAVVMQTLKVIPGAVVEVLGWDEAFVGIETDDPEQVARKVQANVL